MLNKILVPLDGTPVGEAALPYARSLARRSGATLVLVRAVSNARGIEAAEAYIEAQADALISQGFTVETGVPYGPPATWIPSEVELRDADLIVMATHDRANADRWIHGSVAEAVVSHAQVPVVVVRAIGGRPPLFGQTDTTLVVPLDGSEFAEAALPVAREFAWLLGARLVLVGVVADPSQVLVGEIPMYAYTEDDFGEAEAEVREYLARAAKRIASRVPVETVLRVGDASVEIAAEVAQRGAAAVVMATHGRTGLARSIVGSVAGNILHRSAGPVILVRPQVLRGGEAATDDPRHALAGT
jgi:nucleotide-binding universal stress UspA family protein